VGLSSAAIVSVYAVGYANTRDADNGLLQVAQAAGPEASPTAVPQARQQIPVDPAPRTFSNGSQQPTATPTPTRSAGAQAQTQPQSASGYRDGTYVGVGSSRHGGIQATVIVSGGKITSAAITGCGTRYPCSKVTSLVNQVLTIQAPPVNYVSGATDSSQAYYQAVASALTQARAQAG
jgi:uncharacterized protein with FMN-binding domain